MQFFLELFLSLYWRFYQHAVGLNATIILMQVNVAGFRVVNKQENKTREKSCCVAALWRAVKSTSSQQIIILHMRQSSAQQQTNTIYSTLRDRFKHLQFSRMNTNLSKFSEVKLERFALKISDPIEKTLSTAAELGMLVLYFKNTSIQACR